MELSWSMLISINEALVKHICVIIFQLARLREIADADGFDFLGNRGDAMVVDVVSEVFYAEEAFVGVDDDSVRSDREVVKHSSHVIKVLCWGGTGDEYVVDIGVC